MKRLHPFLPAYSTLNALLLFVIFFLFAAGCADSSQSVAAQSVGEATSPTATALPPVTVTATVSSLVTVTQSATQSVTAATAPQQTVTQPAPTVDSGLPLSRTLNILVLGSDRLPNMPNWRTDVMMIVALDFAQQRIGVISIPRDLYLDTIPNHQPNRMNVVDYLGERDEPNGGGPKLLQQIIQQRMGIPTHHFLRFDFASFQEVVNTLGGVEVEIDCRYVDRVINLQPGVQRLTGEQALRYVRSRDIGGDLDRARRQQRFIWAVRNQVLKENLVSRIPSLYQALGDSIQTDIGIVTAIRMARFTLSIDPDNVHSFVIAPPDLLTQSWRQGMFVFIPDWPAITTAAQKIFDRPPFVETNTPARCP